MFQNTKKHLLKKQEARFQISQLPWPPISATCQTPCLDIIFGFMSVSPFTKNIWFFSGLEFWEIVHPDWLLTSPVFHDTDCSSGLLTSALSQIKLTTSYNWEHMVEVSKINANFHVQSVTDVWVLFVFVFIACVILCTRALCVSS